MRDELQIIMKKEPEVKLPDKGPEIRKQEEDLKEIKDAAKKNGDDIIELGGKIDEIAKYCSDGIEDLGNKIKKVEEEIFPLKTKVNDHDNRIAALENRANKTDEAIKHIYSELSKCLRYWILWVIAGLLGGVGVVYILNNFAFKPATIHSYFIGMIGGAIIATIVYLYYRNKLNNQQI